MSLLLPQPAFPPPTSALPALPAPRRRTAAVSGTDSSRLPSASRPSKLAVRTPSSTQPITNASQLAKAVSNPVVPTLRALSIRFPRDADSPDRSVRRSVSISAFPQPPQSPTKLPSVTEVGTNMAGPRRTSGLHTVTSTPPSRITPPSSKRKRQDMTVVAPVNRNGMVRSSSLLNSNGEVKSIPNTVRHRISDGVGSLTSPSHSRSSSAQDSASTSATTFEDVDETLRRGRDEIKGTLSAKTSIREGKENKQNVIVSVRVRPDTSADNSGKSEGEWMVDGRRSLVAFRGREGGDYYYDNVFATHDRNQKVYDASAKRLVRRVMEGYHGTVFAYGMTGTGKTFSMQGTATQPGVIPQAITDIFAYIRETPSREFLLRVSYLEIYNEKIHDLLSTTTVTGVGPGSTQPEEIKLREDSKRGVYASPLKEEIVQSPTQLLRVIARGDHSRRTRSTQFNAQSSRSHAVVQIVVESRERAALHGSGTENKRAATLHGGVRVSTLSMIDLAGSERAADNKERRTEGAHINKSLLTLGTVIARLSSDKDKDGNPTDKEGKHLPYRDSKLTRLLQPALSGNSLVSILCTIQIGSAGSVATASGHTVETLNTLKFAARAKNNIVSHAKRSEEVMGNGADAGAYKGLLERYRLEIHSLKNQLSEQPKAQEKPIMRNEKAEEEAERQAEQRHEEQMLEMQLARTALKERIEHLNRLILSSKSSGVNTKGSLRQAKGNQSNISLHSTARSLHSSTSHSTLNGKEPSIQRTVSIGSSTINGISPNEASSPQSSFNIDADEDEESTGEFGDGTATSNAQIRALQADVADKNRYIATLEKRLLQARRSSQSRTSLAFSAGGRSPSALGGTEDRASLLLQEKDAEIADLRAQLDDKDRMVNALRSATRKRDMAGLGGSPSEPASPADIVRSPVEREARSPRIESLLRRTSGVQATVGRKESDSSGAMTSKRGSPVLLAKGPSSPPAAPSRSDSINTLDSPRKETALAPPMTTHGSNPPNPPNPPKLNTSISSLSQPSPSSPPAHTPQNHLQRSPPYSSSSLSSSTQQQQHHQQTSSSSSLVTTANSTNNTTIIPRRTTSLKSKPAVEDLSIRILDEMIQDRVESGQLMRSQKGSVRAAATAAAIPSSAPNTSIGADTGAVGAGGGAKAVKGHRRYRGGASGGSNGSGNGSGHGNGSGPGMGQLVKGLRGGSMLIEEEGEGA